MSTTIQRQSIVSTIVIFAGFGFGALNLIVLQPHILTSEQWGLTRVITEASVLMASFTTLGSNNVVAKFMPFFKRHLPHQKNDLPFISLFTWSLGLLITISGLLVLQPQIVKIFGRNNPLFQPFYYTLLLFVVFQSVFIYMEMFAWYAGKTILSNLLKELLFRVLTTLCLLALAFQWVDFNGFMAIFGCIYAPAAVIIVYGVVKAKGFPLSTEISKVTRRLKGKMISLGSFVFLTSISNVAFVVCDTLFLASMYSFSQAGIYAVAQYFSQVLEVPMRSMQSSSVPLLSEYWRSKNMAGLQSIYRKSSINLLLAGIGIGGLILVNLHNIEQYFPAEYAVMVLPLVILIGARWINLGTGLNSTIIQLSTLWRFDFASTLIYSVLGIPLNYLLINKLGMIGAAIASVIAMCIYNGVRYLFLYKKFGLQPFTIKTLVLLLGGTALIWLVYLIPAYPNLYVDGAIRCILFASLYVSFIIKAHISGEVQVLYVKWKRKLLLKLK